MYVWEPMCKLYGLMDLIYPEQITVNGVLFIPTREPPEQTEQQAVREPVIKGSFYIRKRFVGELLYDEIGCIRGHHVRYFNIGESNIVVCDPCRTYLKIGSHLWESWRFGGVSQFEAHRMTIRKYAVVR